MKNLNEIIDHIVSRIKVAQIPTWDLYCISFNIYENQFRQYNIEISRESVLFYYIIRTFYSKGDQFGEGIIKANTLESKHIDSYIEKSQELAKLNITSRYKLPQPGQTYPNIKLAEDKVVADAVGVQSKEIAVAVDIWANQ
ncbi:MAG: hypothetical protein ACFFD2_05655 [Promethearchaeota archaeon]